LYYQIIMRKLKNKAKYQNNNVWTKLIKYDYVWESYVLFYLLNQSGEPCIGEKKACEQKVGSKTDVA